MTIKESKVKSNVKHSTSNQKPVLPPPTTISKSSGTYCCDNRLLPCKRCGQDNWKSLGDQDCGDWEEEVFKCLSCNKIIYIELPD